MATPKIIVGKIFRFCASHQLSETSTDKCKNLHGHSYKLEVEFWCYSYEMHQNMVADFTDIKNIIKPIIEQLDHKNLNMVLETDNPTAESIIQWIQNRIMLSMKNFSRLNNNVKLNKLKLWEEIDSAYTCVEI